MPKRPQQPLDKIGVAASIGCAIHCLIAPIVLLIAPAFGGIWVHPGTHLAIASVVLPVAGTAFRKGFGTHGQRWILAGGLLGMAFVLVGTALPFLGFGPASEAGGGCGCCPSLVDDAESGDRVLNVPVASILTMIGGALLVASHIGNLRHCLCCKDPGVPCKSTRS